MRRIGEVFMMRCGVRIEGKGKFDDWFRCALRLELYMMNQVATATSWSWLAMIQYILLANSLSSKGVRMKWNGNYLNGFALLCPFENDVATQGPALLFSPPTEVVRA